MRHTVCKDCTDRVLHCKSWCERWKEESELIAKEKAAEKKHKQLESAFTAIGMERSKRFRK